jgi:hypothetical protein
MAIISNILSKKKKVAFYLRSVKLVVIRPLKSHYKCSILSMKNVFVKISTLDLMFDVSQRDLHFVCLMFLS